MTRIRRLLSRLRPRRPGLRARLTIGFALGGLVLSALLSFVSYGLTRRNLLEQRESAALSQATTNARNLRNQIGTTNITTEELNDDVNSLATPSGSWPVLQYRDVWLHPNAQFGHDALPAALRAAVDRREPARMRFEKTRLDSERSIRECSPVNYHTAKPDRS